MKKINEIIDSLSLVEKHLVYNKLQKKLNKNPEYTIEQKGTEYYIKPKGKYESIQHATLCNCVFETPEMAHLAYAIYLNTKSDLVDILANIKYVFRLLNIDSEWAK